jgi:hypothetical protein
MEPTIEQWFSNSDFQAIPDDEKEQIIANYFDTEIANDDYRKLPENEQLEIRNNFMLEHGFDQSPSITETIKKGVAHGLFGLGRSFGTAIEYLQNRLPSEAPEKIAGTETGEMILTPTQRQRAANKANEYMESGMSGPDAYKQGQIDILKEDTGPRPGKRIAEFYKEAQKPFEPSKEISGNVWDKPELLKKPEWWVYNIADTIPSLAASIIPAAGAAKVIKVGGTALKLTPKVLSKLVKLGSSVAGGAAGGALEATQTYDQVLENGGSEEEAARSAEMMGLFSAGLNAISVGNILSKAGPGFMGRIKKAGLSAIVEGLTEGAEEPAEVVAKLAAKYITGAKMPDNIKELFIDSLKRAATVAPIATATGLGAGAVTPSVETKIPPSETPIEPKPSPVLEKNITNEVLSDLKSGKETVESIIKLKEAEGVKGTQVEKVIDEAIKQFVGQQEAELTSEQEAVEQFKKEQEKGRKKQQEDLKEGRKKVIEILLAKSERGIEKPTISAEESAEVFERELPAIEQEKRVREEIETIEKRKLERLREADLRKKEAAFEERKAQESYKPLPKIPSKEAIKKEMDFIGSITRFMAEETKKDAKFWRNIIEQKPENMKKALMTRKKDSLKILADDSGIDIKGIKTKSDIAQKIIDTAQKQVGEKPYAETLRIDEGSVSERRIEPQEGARESSEDIQRYQEERGAEIKPETPEQAEKIEPKFSIRPEPISRQEISQKAVETLARRVGYQEPIYDRRIKERRAIERYGIDRRKPPISKETKQAILDKGIKTLKENLLNIPIEKDLESVPGVRSVKKAKTGRYILEFDNQYKVPVESVKEISSGKYRVKIGEKIAGKYAGGEIEIAQGVGDKYTVTHELYHWMEDIGIITPKDKFVLNSRIRKERLSLEGGLSEARARFMESAMKKSDSYTGPIRKILKRVGDWIDKVVNVFTRTSRGVIRDIETGKVFKKAPSGLYALEHRYDLYEPRFSIRNYIKENYPEAKVETKAKASQTTERPKTKAEVPQTPKIETVGKINHKDTIDTANAFAEYYKTRKKGWKKEKPDSSFVERILSLPMHHWEKIPAAFRVYQAGTGRADTYYHLINELENSSSGESLLAKMKRFESNKKKNDYNRLGKYLTGRDRNAIGYSVKKDGDLFILSDPNGKEIDIFEDENEAWLYAIQAEAIDAKKSGFSDRAIDALVSFREMTHNGFNLLSKNMKDLQAKLEASGRSIPKIDLWIDGEKTTVNLKTAMSLMGDIRGYYFPRIRKPGRFRLVAKKKGENPRMEFFDSKFFANKRHIELEKQGYSVEKEKSKKMPEDVFSMHSDLIATQQIVNQAIDKLAKEGGATLTDFGLDGGWVGNEFIIKGPFNKKQTEIFKHHGGRYAKYKGETSQRWHFKDAPKDMEKRIMDSLLASENIFSDIEVAFSKAMTDQIANIVKGRGHRAHMIARNIATGKNVWLGYEEDPLTSVAKYIRSLAAGEAKKRMSYDMMKYVTGTDISWSEWKKGKTDPTYRDYMDFVKERRIDAYKQPNIFKEVRSYMEEVLRNQEFEDRVIGSIKGVAVLKYLAGRVSAPLVNLTAMATSVPASMNTYGGINFSKVPRLLTKAGKDYGIYLFGDRKKLDSFTIKLFDTIHDKGWHTAQYNKEALSVLKSKFGVGYDNLIETSMVAFGATERLNRVSTIAGSYMGMIEQGIDHETAIKTAKKISDKSHGVYGRANYPHLARGSNAAAQLARMFYVFKTFSHNYLLTMKDIGVDKKNYKAMTYMALSPAIIAGFGATTIPFFGDIIKLIGKAFGSDDLEEDMYDWLENNVGEIAEGLARYGIAGMGGKGISMKGSLKVDLSVPDEPVNAIDILGAPGNMVMDIVEGGSNIIKGRYSKGAERILPLALAAPLKAWREWDVGLTTGSDGLVFFGTKPVKADTTDAILRSLSFNPARIAKVREKQWKEYKLQQEYRKRKDIIYSAYKRFYAKPVNERPKAELIELANAVRDFNSRVKERKAYLRGVSFITNQSLRTMLKKAFKPSKKEKIREALK